MFVLNLAWQMGVQLGRMGVQAEGTTFGPVHWFGCCCGALHWAFEVGLTLGPRNFHSIGALKLGRLSTGCLWGGASKMA